MSEGKSFVAVLLLWPHRVLIWLAGAWLAIFAAVVIALAIGVVLFLQTEQSMRLSGLGLQLFGLGAAAIGIRDTRRIFGKPSFLGLVRKWLSAIPGIRTHLIMEAGSGSFSVSASGRAQFWRGAGPEPTVESRLAAVEANTRQLHERANLADSAFDTHVREAALSLQNEKELRQEGDRQLHIKIESATADGLHLAAVGALWLAFGVVMSTASNELLILMK